MGDFVVWFKISFFLLFTLWVLRRHYYNKCLLFISFLYLASSFFALIYYKSEESVYTNLTIEGALLFIFFFLLSIIPIFYIKYLSWDKIRVNNKVIRILCLLIFYCSIFPFFYQLFSLFSLLSGNYASTLSHAHDYRMDYSIQGGGNLIYNLCIKIASWCNNILPILFVFVLQKYQKVNKYIIGIFFSQIALLIGAFTSSSRSFIADYYLSYIFVYCLFYDYLTDYAKLFFKKLLKFVGIIVLFLFSLITISRAFFLDKNDFSSTLEWVAQYAGEGMLNFNEYIVPQKFVKGVDDIFPYLLPKSRFDFYQKASNRDIDSYWGKYTSKPEYVFYTSYGVVVDAFGIIPSILGVTGLSILLCLYLKRRQYYLSSIALFVLYSRYIYYGVMLFPYSGISGNKYLFQSLFICFILYCSEKYMKKNGQKRCNYYTR